MQTEIYDPTAPKRPANLSINNDLLRRARALKINLSQTLERCLVDMLQEEQRRAWKEENQEAVDAYNRRVQAAGVFSNGVRRF